RRASKSPSRTRNRHVAAARCPASLQICASTRSSGTRAGSAGDAATSADGETAANTEPRPSESNIHFTLALGSDKTAGRIVGDYAGARVEAGQPALRARARRERGVGVAGEERCADAVRGGAPGRVR